MTPLLPEPDASRAASRSRPDAAGVSHPADWVDARIVSLVPSLTELLFELGAGANLIGRTGFCIHPQAAHAVRKVGGTKDVNLERIRAMAPSHVIVNIDENRLETVDALREFVPHIVVTHPQVVTDNLEVYRLFGELFGVRERAEQLAQSLAAVLLLAQQQRATPLRVLYLIWKDPWMSVSPQTYIADMLRLAQMEQIEIDSSRRYPQLALADVADRIDAILLSSEPYSFTRIDVDSMQQALAKPTLLVDGERLSWYGSRAIAGVPYACEVRADLERLIAGHNT